MPGKYQEDAPILVNQCLQGDYHRLDMRCRHIVRTAGPGQFVHLQMPEIKHRLLRRPFSIFDVNPETGVLSIIYKVVGEGTAHLSRLSPGTVLNLLGPLGTGFSLPVKKQLPVIVAGGYGCAATWLLARRSPTKPICLLGGRSRQDLLLVEEYKQLAAEVRVATNDGSEGRQGMVTDLLPEILQYKDTRKIKIYACGPAGMIKAVAAIADQHGMIAEVSLDHAMCCGVGACFACVVKVKTDKEPGWTYARTCLEGPVFNSDRLLWE